MERNPLATADINGSVKTNQFGQKMEIDERLYGMAAGQLKAGSNQGYQKQNSSNAMADCFNIGAQPEPVYQQENATAQMSSDEAYYRQ